MNHESTNANSTPIAETKTPIHTTLDTTVDANKASLIDIIDRNAAEITALADQIWDLAEVRFACPKSSALLANYLASKGFTIEKEPAQVPNSFIARYHFGGEEANAATATTPTATPTPPTTTIGFLAEYDALPGMSQQADVPKAVAAEPGAAGHGCGHHAIGTGSVAAAVALAEYITETKMPANLVVFGCPAEEEGYGKAFLARAGVFDEADCLFSWHPMTNTAVWGQSTLASNQLYFTFAGIPAHAGANPELGRSALDAAELMNVGVQFLREHVTDGTRIHYAFLDVGGQAANVVQASAKLQYIIRAKTQAEALAVTNRVIKIAEGAALMTETTVSVEWNAAAAEYIVNRTLGGLLHENLAHITPLPYTEADYAYMAPFQATLPDIVTSAQASAIRTAFPDLSADEQASLLASPISDRLFPLAYSDTPMTASTDVADASWIRPTGQVTIAYGPNGSAPHCWQWVATGKSHVAHIALLTAAKALALTSLDLLQDPALLAAATAEHERNLGGRHYQSAMPDTLLPA